MVVALDETDKELLRLIQEEFPLVKKPWMEIASRLNISEGELTSRLKRLYDAGVILKIGPILNAREIGLGASTLIAMKVPEDRIEEVASIINEFEGVSHNYERGHQFNLWFTIVTCDENELRRTIEEIKRKTKIDDADTMNLPAKRVFKIDVRFLIE